MQPMRGRFNKQGSSAVALLRHTPYFIAIAVLSIAIVLPLMSRKVSAATGITKVSQLGIQTTAITMPTGIDVDSNGNIYTFSYLTGSIIKTSSTGAFIAEWGGIGGGDGEFQDAYNLALDSDNNVYVADDYNNRVQKFDSSGNLIAKWGSSDIGNYGGVDGGSMNGSGDDEFTGPSKISTDANNNVYVIDRGNNRLKKLNSSGDMISTWGWGVQDGTNSYQVCTSNCQQGIYNDLLLGTFGGQIGGLDIDSSGNVFITNSSRNSIDKFDSNGTFLRSIGWGVQDGSNEFQICTSSCQAGLEGAGEGQFGYMPDIIVDGNNNIFVTDQYESSSRTSRVQKFDSSGNFVTQWGGDATCVSEGDTFENGKFCEIYGLAVDSTNNVYVTDAGNNTTQKFDNNGNFLEHLGNAGLSNGSFTQPYGNAVDSDGNVYVTDAFNNRVQKFDSSGNFITKWGAKGADNGQFYAPLGIAVDSQNNVYVTEVFNNRVQKFDSSGSFIAKWQNSDLDSYGIPQTSSDEGKFNQPTGIVIDSTDNVYVADTSNNRIQKFNKDGGFIDAWGKLGPYGEPNSGEGDGEYNYPGGMAIDSSNNIYVADNQNDRIQKFTSSGVFVSNIGSTGSNNGQLNKPTGLAIDSSDNMYVADTENNRIQKFNSSGAYESQYALSSYSPALPYSITGISTATNGRLYIGEGAQGRVSALCDSDESSNGCVLGASTANVVVPNAVNTKPISLSQTGCANITNAASLASSALGTQDTDSAYPLGLVGFVLTGCASGGSSTVTVAFAGTSNPKTVKLRKYNASTKKYTDITDAKLTATTISGQAAVQAVYTITDGGPLDGDGTANGSIEDPVGLVTVSGGTLANTGVIAVSTTLLLGLIIGSFTYVYFDYRKHKAPLKAQNPKVKYTLAHHLKVVTIPLLRYRLQVQIARVDNSPIKKW